MIKSSQTVLDQFFLNWCYPKFILYIIISDLISPCMVTYPTQYPCFGYIHLLDVLSFYSPTFCTLHHHMSNRHHVEFTFSLFWTFLSQRMPNACRYFTNPALILRFTFSSIPPSLCNIDHKYRNMSFMSITCPSRLTSLLFELSSLNWHFVYLVLVLLSLKPFDSEVRFHNFSFWSTFILLSSINIT
jgi:hypothetical protein